MEVFLYYIDYLNYFTMKYDTYQMQDNLSSSQDKYINVSEITCDIYIYIYIYIYDMYIYICILYIYI